MAVSTGWTGDEHAAVVVPLFRDVVGGALAAGNASEGEFVGGCDVRVYGGRRCVGIGRGFGDRGWSGDGVGVTDGGGLSRGGCK